MSILRYQMVIVWSDKDNSYLVHLPDFPEQTYRTQGDSYADAAKNGEAILRQLDQPAAKSQIAIEIYPASQEQETDRREQVLAQTAALEASPTAATAVNGAAPVASDSSPSVEKASPFPWLMTAFASISTSAVAVALLLTLAFLSEGLISVGTEASTPPSTEDSETENPDAETGAQAKLGSSTTVAPLALTNSITESSAVWAIDAYSDRSRNINLIVSGTETGLITITDLKSAQPVRRIDAHKDKVRDIAIAPNSRRLISSSGDGIKVWNLETGELLYSLPSPAPVWSVAIAPDESRFISGDADGNITAWDFETGKSLYSVGDGAAVWSVAISPSGESFVSGNSDRTIRQWNLATGAPMKTFSGHQSDVRAVTISPDGKTLVSGSWDNTVKLWSLATGKLQTTLEGHRSRVVSLAISSDGSTLASGSVDTSIKLWRLSDYQLIDSLDDRADWVLSLAFTKDRALLVGGRNEDIEVWQ